MATKTTANKTESKTEAKTPAEDTTTTTEDKVDAPKIADVQKDAPVGQDAEVTRDPAADALAAGESEARWDYAAKATKDVNDGWTIQQTYDEAEEQRTYEVPEAQVGQAFTERQLPDVDSQRAAGINPEQFRAGLTVLSDEEALKSPAGPEPDEAYRLGLTK